MCGHLWVYGKACWQQSTGKVSVSAVLVSELIETRDEKKLLRFQKQIASYELLIVDKLGFVPLSKTGAELLFEILSQRYERGSTLITSNLFPNMDAAWMRCLMSSLEKM